MKKTLGKVKYSARGFEYIDFTDRYGEQCHLLQSSLADYIKPGISAVWLGAVDNPMHLDRKQVIALIAHLQNWLENDTFKLVKKT